MTKNMTDEQIDKIARAIAAKIGEPGGPVVLGCGSASATGDYNCSAYTCSTSYQCGGAGYFTCGGSSTWFNCRDAFKCYSYFTCYGSGSHFICSGTYNP